MNSNEDNSSSISSEEIKNVKSKSIWVLISSINDKVSIHTSINNFQSDPQLESHLEGLKMQQKYGKNKIIDICSIVKRKSTKDIKEISINSVLNYTGEPNITVSTDQDSKKVMQINNQKWLTFDTDPLGLEDRNKNEKLSKIQIQFLYDLMKNQDFSVKQLSSIYQISPSVLYKIKRKTNEDIAKGPEKKFNKILKSNKEILTKELMNLIVHTNIPLNAVEVTKIVNDRLKTNYNSSFIRKILKYNLHMSFKRIKSRPNSIDLNRVKAIRQLYIVKLWQEITVDTLIVNIDESSINRSIMTNYSWGIKGVAKEATNAPFSGSLSIIMSILSNGNWMAFFKNSTINADIFKTYFQQLSKWINKNQRFNYKTILIILDNCSIHKEKEVKKILNKIDAKILFLSPYSPQFAPIEMYFGLFKKYLKEKFKREHIKLNAKENISAVIQWLKSIKSETIRKLFKNMYSSINKAI